MWYLISSKSTVRSFPTFITDKTPLNKLQMCIPTNLYFLNNQRTVTEHFDNYIPQHFDDDDSDEYYSTSDDSDFNPDEELCIECEEFYNTLEHTECPCVLRNNSYILSEYIEVENRVSMTLEDINVNSPCFFYNYNQLHLQFILEYGEHIGSKYYVNYIHGVSSITDYKVQSLNLNYLAPLIFKCDDVNWMIKLLEDVGILVHYLCKSKSFSEYSMAILLFVKLRTDGPILNSDLLSQLEEYFKRLFGEHEVQGVEECLSSARQYLNRFDEVKKSPIFTKLYKFSMYALSLSLFKKLGLTFDFLGYSRLESEAIRRRYHRGIDFYRTMADTALFLCERGYQCVKTGEMDPIFHSGATYQDFYDKSTKLLQQSLLLNEPALYGFTEFEFLSDLDKSIEHGENIYKHATRIGEEDRTTVRSYVNKLLTVKFDLMTRSRARESRKPPMSVLIYGDTSVGKSSITDMIFQYYGKLRGLPTSSEYKYTRNPAANFADGFRTMQWCYQLDDIAFMNPDAAPNGDRSVLEILQLINAVPYVPDQAALEDKGRIPFRGELVIATTNRKDLHAHPYFSCPSAVQRRFPFVIDVKPKPQYRNAAGMLDSTAIGDIEFDDFPDLWDFTIEKVVPTTTRANHTVNANYVVIHKDLSLREFLLWFKETVENHHINQDRVSRSVNKMSTVQLKICCQLPPSQCTCNVEVQAKNTHVEVGFLSKLWSFVFNSAMMILYLYYICIAWDLVWPRIKLAYYICKRYGRKILVILYIQYRIVRWTIDFNNRWFFWKIRMQMWFYSTNADCLSENLRLRFERSYFKSLGDRIQRSIGYPAFLAIFVGFLASGVALYKFKTSIYSVQADSPLASSDEESEEELSISEEIGKPPVPGDNERMNPWKASDSHELSSFDFTCKALSWNRFEKDQVIELLSRNCYFVTVRWDCPTDKVGKYKIARMTCLGGRIFMMNKHLLPPPAVTHFRMELRSQPNNPGVTANRVLFVTRSMFLFDSSDIALISLGDMDAHRSIVDLFITQSFQGLHDGFVMNRDASAQVVVRNTIRYKYHEKYYCSYFEESGTYPFVPTWFGRSDLPTEDGDCGSLHIVMTGYGPVILGIHYLGRGNEVGCIDIRKEYLEKRLQAIEEPQIQSSHPLLSSSKVKRELGSLHTKSVVNYIEEGSARVYGSFVGSAESGSKRFKSMVEITPMAHELSNHGYAIKHGPPCLTGWEPKRKALIEMVNINNRMDHMLLKECADSFLSDIMSKLPSSEMSKLHVYDTFTSINGAAGISYVDKINRTTSAGCPWKKSKKHFMIPIEPKNDLLDPITFNDDVMERVEHMTDSYFRGYRSHMVFSASLKDEATSFLKILNKKTRVFTGAPLDGTIVIRKFYLAFIRLIQSNRFVFECGAGTIAQSLEWEEIMKYLTTFGTNNIVAGDYKNFDKSMFAYVIWLSFWILIQIAKRSGNYSFREIIALYGIAEDIAFPTVDFFGELIAFFGSNPSGHPLTVIINSLANSLYMRYAYASLNPAGHCRDFQEYVHLMTYGDDNVMGVHPSHYWFNHTAIQEILGRCGITYTMAEKDAESKPFISIKDVSFLKRTWRYDEDIGAYVGPLDHESINKMLMVWKRSKSISSKEQCIAVITSVVREYFWYGRATFELKKNMLQNLIPLWDLELYVQDSTFPSYEELREDFWNNSKHVSRK